MKLKPIKKRSKTSEKVVEAYLVKQVKTVSCTAQFDNEIVVLTGTSYKFTSPMRRSVPDRICLFPKGLVVYVECKSLGEKPTDAQIREANRLRALGFLVISVDSKKQVDNFINSMKQLYVAGDSNHESNEIQKLRSIKGEVPVPGINKEERELGKENGQTMDLSSEQDVLRSKPTE